MKNKLLVDVYDLSIHKKNQKLERLKKIHASDKRELSKLQAKIVKVKSNKPVKKDSIKRQNKYLHDLQIAKNNVNLHKKKLSKLNNAILELRKEIRNNKSEKRDYINTISKLNKAWKEKNSTLHKIEQQDSDHVFINSFKGHIRAARALLNLSRAEFSDLLAIDESTLTKIESKSNSLDITTINTTKLYKKLELAGIEFINDGLFVGFGGIGVRLNRNKHRTPVLNVKKLSKKASANKKQKQQYKEKSVKAA